MEDYNYSTLLRRHSVASRSTLSATTTLTDDILHLKQIAASQAAILYPDYEVAVELEMAISVLLCSAIFLSLFFLSDWQEMEIVGIGYNPNIFPEALDHVPDGVDELTSEAAGIVGQAVDLSDNQQVSSVLQRLGFAPQYTRYYIWNAVSLLTEIALVN